MIIPSCRETARRLASGEFADAGLLARLLVRAHLAVCAGCRRFRAQLAVIGEAARDLAAAGRAPEGLSSRILARLGGPS